MTRWAIAAAVLVAAVVIVRVFAFGRKAPQTLTQQKDALFGGQPARFTRTQERDVEQLDMTPKKLTLVKRA